MKFPRTVKVSIKNTTRAGLPGHAWNAISRDGTFLGDGFSEGSRADAHKAAWNALEQMGLVTDE